MSGTCRYTATGDLECIYSKTPQVTPDNNVTFQSPMITETKSNNDESLSSQAITMIRKLQAETGLNLLGEGFQNAPPRCSNFCNGADAACIAYNADQGKCTR